MGKPVEEADALWRPTLPDELPSWKLYLPNWKLICKKKEFSGLGIPDLANVNLYLLGSWLKRYIKMMVSCGNPWLMLNTTRKIPRISAVELLGFPTSERVLWGY